MSLVSQHGIFNTKHLLKQTLEYIYTCLYLANMNFDNVTNQFYTAYKVHIVKLQKSFLFAYVVLTHETEWLQ